MRFSTSADSDFSGAYAAPARLSISRARSSKENGRGAASRSPAACPSLGHPSAEATSEAPAALSTERRLGILGDFPWTMRDIGGGAIQPVNEPPPISLRAIRRADAHLTLGAAPACVVPKVLSRLAAQRVSRESRARHPTSGTLAA